MGSSLSKLVNNLTEGVLKCKLNVNIIQCIDNKKVRKLWNQLQKL